MTGPLQISSKNTLTSTAAVDITDDILFTFGNDSDGVILNRSTILAADTALTGVLEATVESQAIAANTLMIANTTSNGDLAMYINKATNSQMVLWADGSTGDTALLASSGASVDHYIAGTKVLDHSSGAFAFQENTTLSSTGTLTLGAITLSGAIAGGDQAFTNIGDMTFATGSILASGSTNGNTLILKANDTAFITLTTGATDECEIESATMKGTWLADGTVTMPALVLGGQLNVNAQNIINVGDMTFDAGSILASGSTNTNTLLLKANDTTFITFTTGATDVCTINAPTMSGTWLASGTVTMPALSMGGALIWATDATYNIGASGATRPNNVYAANNIYAGNLIAATGRVQTGTAYGILVGTEGVRNISTNDNDYYDIAAYDVNGSAYSSVIRIQNANSAAAPIEMGFFGATPVYRQAHIADATDTSASDQSAPINAIIAALETFGLLATS